MVLSLLKRDRNSLTAGVAIVVSQLFFCKGR